MAPEKLTGDSVDESTLKINIIMRRKLALLHEIYALSEQASGYINEADIERLGNIIADKQELIDSADHADRMFLAEFANLKAQLGIASMEELRVSQSPQLGELRRNTAEIFAMIEKIYTLDENINRGILKLREDITADLTRIRKQKHISSLYSNDGAQHLEDGHRHYDENYGNYGNYGNFAFDIKK